MCSSPGLLVFGCSCSGCRSIGTESTLLAAPILQTNLAMMQLKLALQLLYPVLRLRSHLNCTVLTPATFASHCCCRSGKCTAATAASVAAEQGCSMHMSVSPCGPVHGAGNPPRCGCHAWPAGRCGKGVSTSSSQPCLGGWSAVVATSSTHLAVRGHGICYDLVSHMPKAVYVCCELLACNEQQAYQSRSCSTSWTHLLLHAGQLLAYVFQE